jgi:hypothetical protein
MGTTGSTAFDGDAAVASAVTQLDMYARKHYRLKGGLSELLGEVETPKGRKQYARLLGVIVKAPFAVERARPPSESTAAVFAMDWLPGTEVSARAEGSWQLEVMRSLLSDDRQRSIESIPPAEALMQFKYESSLGKFIFAAFRRRICDNPQTSKEVKVAIEQAKKAGVTLVEPTTAGISVGTASLIAVALAQVLPGAMVAVASPLIGGVALLLMQVGVEGFCNWSNQVINEPDPPAQDP